MEEGAVLCQRDRDSQKMMKAKKERERICNLYKTDYMTHFQVIFKKFVHHNSLIDQYIDR